MLLPATSVGTASTTTRPDGVTAPVLLVRAPAGGTVGYAGRRYRGSIVFTGTSSGMSIATEVDVEDYLRGMGEIRDPRWPAASLRAQAIAARTFALDTMAKVGEVCPTQRCQVYLGAQAEYPEMDAAVKATAGKVLTYQGRLILAFYSASGGGSIATPEEAFGGKETFPYLRPGGYLTGDVQRWEIRIALRDLAGRLGYRGTPSAIRVSRVGPSGRPLEVTMSGSAGDRSWTGTAVDRALGLKSNLFSFRVEESATAPVLPPAPPAVGELAISAQGAILSAPTTTIAGATIDASATTTTAVVATTVPAATTVATTSAPVDPVATTVAPAMAPPDDDPPRSRAAAAIPVPLLSGVATVVLLGAAALMARRWRLD